MGKIFPHRTTASTINVMSMWQISSIYKMLSKIRKRVICKQIGMSILRSIRFRLILTNCFVVVVFFPKFTKHNPLSWTRNWEKKERFEKINRGKTRSDAIVVIRKSNFILSLTRIEFVSNSKKYLKVPLFLSLSWMLVNKITILLFTKTYF